MRHPKLVTTLVAAAMLTGSVVGVAAVAVPAGAASASRHFSTLTLGATLTSQHYVDNAPTGMSPGDVIVFTNTLRWTGKHHALAGTEYASCTVITATPTATESFCTGALSLNGLGEISLAGVVSLNQVGQAVRVPVTGGTGRYFGVHGDMHYRQGAASTVLHLRLAY